MGAVGWSHTARMTENTLIHTGLGAGSTIWDVAKGVDLSGRRAIVTGASSGIGIETARALAATGAEVVLAVRDTIAGELTAVDIRGTTGNQAVRVGRLDLADLDSVRAFVAAWAMRPVVRRAFARRSSGLLPSSPAHLPRRSSRTAASLVGRPSA